MRFDTIDINRLADRQRISEWLQLGYWLWLLAALIIACGCNRITNPRESKQVAIQQADAQLVYERTIDLGDSGGPALGAPTTFAVTDGAFYLVDDLHKAVFEYDIEGQYIHTIGRRGKGKGEYLSPMSIGVGQGGQVYVYDAVTAKLNTYGRDGRFIGQFSASNKMTVGKFVVDKQGDILQMIGAQDASGKRVVRLLKTAPRSEVPDFSIDVAKGELGITFIRHFGFCYDLSRQRVYYMPPWDYEIVEVDARTGELLQRFGLEPPGFKSLETETGGPDMVEEILNLPHLRNMALLGENLLFVQFAAGTFGEKSTTPRRGTDEIEDPTRTFCVLYDLTDSNKITARVVQDPGNALNYNVKIRSVGQSLYVYSPPSGPGSGVNGHIDIYSFDFDSPRLEP
jgi:hypothetical protein